MQDETQAHWVAPWIQFGYENITHIAIAGIAVLAALFALRSWKYNRPVLRRERWWSRIRIWLAGRR